MEPERRRGAEYKAQARGERGGFGNDPDRGHIEGPKWIADGIAQKVGKNYAGATDLHLLVYANFNGYQLQHADVVAAALPHLPAFASVWVVTNLWLGTISSADDIGRTPGWCIIFTPEDWLADRAG